MKSKIQYYVLVRVIKPIMALAALLSLSGCGPSEVAVKGNVFVATKGGTNYKLALVEVKALPASQFDEIASQSADHIRSSMQQYASLIEPLADKYRSDSEDYRKALEIYNSELSAFRKRMHGASNSYTGVSYVGQSIRFYKHGNYPSSLVSEFQRTKDSILQQAGALRAKYEAFSFDTRYRTLSQNMEKAGLYSPYSYFKEKTWEKLKSAAPHSATSDADGNFTFILPKKTSLKYILLANGKRSVGNEEESYSWVRIVELGSKETELKILLSNNEIIDEVELAKMSNFNPPKSNLEFHRMSQPEALKLDIEER